MRWVRCRHCVLLRPAESETRRHGQCVCVVCSRAPATIPLCSLPGPVPINHQSLSDHYTSIRAAHQSCQCEQPVLTRPKSAFPLLAQARTVSVAQTGLISQSRIARRRFSWHSLVQAPHSYPCIGHIVMFVSNTAPQLTLTRTPRCGDLVAGHVHTRDRD